MFSSSIVIVKLSFIESNIPSSGTIYNHSLLIVEYLTVFKNDSLSDNLNVIFLPFPSEAELKSSSSGASLY